MGLLYPVEINQDSEIFLAMGNDKKKVGEFPKDKVMRFEHKIETGLLPPGVRFIHPTRKLVIFDRPPTEVTIRYYGTMLNNVQNSEEQLFTIQLPWTAYCVYLSDQYIEDVYLYSIGKYQLQNVSRLGLLPIPNYYLDGRFCLPEEKIEYTDIADAIDKAYSLVWDSNFNNDVTEVVREYYMLMEQEEFDFLASYISPPHYGAHSISGVLQAFEDLSEEETAMMKQLAWMQSPTIPDLGELPSMSSSYNPNRFIEFLNEEKA